MENAELNDWRVKGGTETAVVWWAFQQRTSYSPLLEGLRLLNATVEGLVSLKCLVLDLVQVQPQSPNAIQ
jgi:hypothetical protein